MRKNLIAEMTWEDIREIVQTKDMVIIPAGSIENNGPHLPLSLDLIVADEVARLLSAKTSIPMAPAFPWGNSSLFSRFPGTIVIRSETLIELVKDIIRSLGKHGFRRFLILTPHLPNIWSFNIAGEALIKEGYLVITIDWWRLQNMLCADLAEGKLLPMGHASELATSLLWALRPDLIRLEKIQAEAPSNSFYLKYSPQYPVLFMNHDMKKLSDCGVIGNPSKASIEKGEEIIKRCLKYLVEFCDDFQKVELPQKE